MSWIFQWVADQYYSTPFVGVLYLWLVAAVIVVAASLIQHDISTYQFNAFKARLRAQDPEYKPVAAKVVNWPRVAAAAVFLIGVPAAGVSILYAPQVSDVFWMSASIPLAMMAISGAGVFYSARASRTQLSHIATSCLLAVCLVTILWVVVTYSLAFTSGSPWFGSLDRLFLIGLIGSPKNTNASAISEILFCLFQLMLAIVTMIIIIVAFAGRMKPSAMIWFIGVWSICVYAPVAHWIWGPDGFLAAGNGDGAIRMLDFAGGAVVHVNASVAGLMCALLLGRRPSIQANRNVLRTIVGTGLLWVGSLGFIAGSAVLAGLPAGVATTAIHVALASASAAFVWIFAEHMRGRGPTPFGASAGALAGLVAVTPAAGFVSPFALVAIGAIAGITCYWAMTALKNMLGDDQALEAFSIHGIGGIAGVMLTGVFAARQYGGAAGLIDGNAAQLVNQVSGIAIVIGYDAIVSLFILKSIDTLIGLGVPKEVQAEEAPVTIETT